MKFANDLFLETAAILYTQANPNDPIVLPPVDDLEGRAAARKTLSNELKKPNSQTKALLAQYITRISKQGPVEKEFNHMSEVYKSANDFYAAREGGEPDIEN